MEFTNESPYKFFKERDRFLCVLFSGAGISADCAAGFVLPGVKIAVLAHTARSTRAILPKQESHLAGWLN